MIIGLDALAALELSNLLYLAGAIVVATLISALIALSHHRPKSLESGIESFSRELRALAPEPDGRDGTAAPSPPHTTVVAVRPRQPAATRGPGGRSPTSDGPGTHGASTDERATPGRPDPAGPGVPVDTTHESSTREDQAG